MSPLRFASVASDNDGYHATRLKTVNLIEKQHSAVAD
jgi:hypothetical protein